MFRQEKADLKCLWGKKHDDPGSAERTACGGFTLLEIVIVLTIIGFLLAMIAPRLGNIGTSAVERIDESNLKDMSGYITIYQQQKDRLPNKPITIVNSSPGDSYQLPLIDDGDADNGPETISLYFQDRCKLQLHILNAAEADELRRMGIRRVAVLNDYEGSTNAKHVKDGEGSDLKPQKFASGDKGRSMNMVDVEAGLGVLMVGAGSTSKDAKVKPVVDEDDTMGTPEWIYRIVLGLGADSSLVTEGMVQNEGLSPQGMQSADYNTYNNYNMVLPRLLATVNRITGGSPKKIKVGNSQYKKDDEKSRQKEYDLDKVQDLWEVEVCNPMGYKWPRDTVERWEIVEILEKF